LKKKLTIYDYVDKIYIIHLPELTDRKKKILGELSRLGVESNSPKLEIPYAPRPESINGFASRGV
jgi:glycosyl transferase, family 25